MAGRREQNRRETRTRVLEAAKVLFPDRGISGTTTAELASAARISRATFFNHFGSKEELLVALWEEQVGNLATQISENLAVARSSQERIQLLFSQLVESVDRRPGYLKAVALELERSGSPESTSERGVLFHAQMQRIIDAGLAQGDVRTDHAPRLLAEMLGAAYLTVLRNLRLVEDYDLRNGAVEVGAFIADAVCA